MSGFDLERQRAARLKNRHVMALCSTGASGGVYTVEDWSRDGMLLEGRTTFPPGKRIAVRVLMRGELPVDVRACVMSTAPGPQGRNRMELRFFSLAPDAEDRIANLIAVERASLQKPWCVVAADSIALRTRFARRLRSLDWQVLQARTPAELIHHLDSHAKPTAVFLGATVGARTVAGLACFLRQCYPRLRRVFVVESDCYEDDVVREVFDAVIKPPWDIDQLHKLPGPKDIGDTSRWRARQ